MSNAPSEDPPGDQHDQESSAAGGPMPRPGSEPELMPQARPASSARRRLWTLRGGPPTEPMPIVDLLHRSPYRRPVQSSTASEARTVRAALDLAARVGELMLRSGAGAPQVEGSVVAIATAAGLKEFEVDITLQSLLLQARTGDGVIQTQLRVVRSTRADHARLVAIHELVDAMADGELDVPAATEQLRLIKSTRRTFSTLLTRTARAVLAAAVAGMIGASVTATVLTFVVVLLVASLQRLTDRLRLPEFYDGALVAGASTVLAWGAYVLGANGWLEIGANDFAFIVAGGIVALLPGRAMAAAVEDVLSGYAVTGAGRLLAVTLSLLGLIIGIALALSVTLRLTEFMGVGFVSPSVLSLRVTGASVPAALIGAFFVGAAGAVTLQTRRKVLLPVGVLGLLGAAVFAAGTRVLDVGPISATGLAAVVIGAGGRVLAQRLNVPSMVVVVPASFGLLPGLTIFRGLYEMVGQADPGTLALQSGITTLFSAGAVLLAIATGTTFGEILASPWDHVTRRAAARRVRA